MDATLFRTGCSKSGGSPTTRRCSRSPVSRLSTPPHHLRVDPSTRDLTISTSTRSIEHVLAEHRSCRLCFCELGKPEDVLDSRKQREVVVRDPAHRPRPNER